MEDTLLLQKEVDKSVLYQGMSIPAAFHKLFYERIGFTLNHGEKRNINIMLDGEIYPVQLINQPFNQDKFSNRVDVLQIRYGDNSPIARKMREKFASTLQAVQEFRSNPENAGRRVIIPTDEKEYVVLYATPEKGTIMADCINRKEYTEETKALSLLNEVDYELAIDRNATILIETGIKKVRRLSKAIGNSLKIIYGFRCQICGQFIGQQYGSELIHAHHIDYFTKSLNNDADNIMIVCPNHHGIIHDKNPEFDREKKIYKFPNGYCEGLKLNLHL